MILKVLFTSFSIVFTTEMESGTASPAAPVKKGLQELSKEELIQKCKGLLNIAQKAKQAKDGKK